MNQLLINGCFDRATFQMLKSLGVKRFGFDFRPRSTSLITFDEINFILSQSSDETFYLIFEDEKEEIIKSTLDLLKVHQKSFILQFRDRKSLKFYQQLGRPVVWMFDPDCDWKEILNLDNVKGVILPYELSSFFQVRPDLWEIIEYRNLEVILHAKTAADISLLSTQDDVFLSFDLENHFMKSYRNVNQVRLRETIMGRAE